MEAIIRIAVIGPWFLWDIEHETYAQSDGRLSLVGFSDRDPKQLERLSGKG